MSNFENREKCAMYFFVTLSVNLSLCWEFFHYNNWTELVKKGNREEKEKYTNIFSNKNHTL